jgi:ribosome-associated heat shock protein Hsp15
MRIDKFLYFVRLTKTRSLAQKMLNESSARMDGRAITSAHANAVVGSVLTLPIQHKIRVIKIEALPHRRGPAEEARACYSELSTDLIDVRPARL